MESHIIKLNKDPYTYSNKLDTPTIVKIIEVANEYYYNNNNTIMSDEVYDILKDTLEERHPDHPLLFSVGANPVIEKMKVKLPYWMGSMNKIKPGDKKLALWFNKYKGNSYVISDKLDGVSCLYYIKNNNRKLFTRGNGSVGYDISHLIPYLNLPDINPLKLFIDRDEICVRGEIILSKEKFKKYDNSNARNLVSGLVNSKKINVELAKDVDVIMYELVDFNTLTPKKQMNMMKNLGFNVVNYTHLKNDMLSNPKLSEKLLKTLLIKRRQEAPYEIDGIIVSHNEFYKKNTSGNPKHSFAFKMVFNEQIKETTIKNVEWNASKDGYLKPRINVETINLGGVNISYTTGFNAKYIVDNNIGPGAIVSIIRSGDVIPYIKEIIQPAQEPQMPNYSYSWTDTHVDIFLNEINNDVIIKRLTLFFKKIGVESLNIGLMNKIFDAGFNTIKKILNASIDDFKSIPGFKEKLATKIYTNIHNVVDNPIDLVLLMVASGSFGRGFGEKKIIELLTIKNILDVAKQSDICQLDGFSTKTTLKAIEGLKNFDRFMKENTFKIDYSNPTSGSYYKNKKQCKSLDGFRVVFTGSRDKELMNYIISCGGKISNSVSKNTSVVVTKSLDTTSKKIEKAKQLNIKIMTLDNFKNQLKTL